MARSQSEGNAYRFTSDDGSVAFDLRAGARVSIGRESSNSVVIDLPFISRRHALVKTEGESVEVVTNLNSTRGTYVNGSRVLQPTPVHEGDVLSFGNLNFRIRQVSGAIGTEHLTVASRPANEALVPLPVRQRVPTHEFRPSHKGRNALLVGVLVAVIGGVFAIAAAYIDVGVSPPVGETASLAWDSNRVRNDGSVYQAKADGMQSGEIVRFTWSADQTGVRHVIQADIKADDSGTAAVSVHEGAAAGVYIIFAHGMRSGKDASSALLVVDR